MHVQRNAHSLRQSRREKSVLDLTFKAPNPGKYARLSVKTSFQLYEAPLSFASQFV